MRQQINLYQPIFREERKALSARSVAIALVLIAAGLAGVAVYARQNVAALETNVQALRDQVNRQQEQLAQASEQTGNATAVDAAARIKQLAVTVAERERALQLLQSGAAGQTTGFAARLEALARRHVPGLWLDGMKLSGIGSHMSLQGATTNPDIVPVYLRSLAADPVLAGTRFDEFVIQRPPLGKLEPKAPGEAEDGTAPTVIAQPTVRFSAGSTSLATSNATPPASAKDASS